MRIRVEVTLDEPEKGSSAAPVERGGSGPTWHWLMPVTALLSGLAKLIAQLRSLF